MPNTLKKPRVSRKYDPTTCFAEHELRNQALDQLLSDFADRCAYSLIHVEAVSKHNMEVDHHNPNITGEKRNAYSNLYPAFSLINNHKRKRWPNENQKNNRQRFLDPCKETDYGNHIFEDHGTGTLIPASPEAVYHIENLGLNHDWLKAQRRKRTENQEILAALLKLQKIDGNTPVFKNLVASFSNDIPAIDPLPAHEQAY